MSWSDSQNAAKKKSVPSGVTAYHGVESEESVRCLWCADPPLQFCAGNSLCYTSNGRRAFSKYCVLNSRPATALCIYRLILRQ